MIQNICKISGLFERLLNEKQGVVINYHSVSFSAGIKSFDGATLYQTHEMIFNWVGVGIRSMKKLGQLDVVCHQIVHL